MRWNEFFGDHKGFRSGALQRHGVPIVDHLGVALGHQEKVRTIETVLLHNAAAADQPVGIVDAAGKTVTPRIQEAAVHARRPPGRIERGGCDGVVVRAPDLFLRLRREGRDQHGVIGKDVLQPSLRSARRRQHFTHVAQHVPAMLVAAIAGRLAHLQQSGTLEVRNRFVGHATRSLATLGTFLQHRHERPRAVHQVIGARMARERDDVGIGRVHARGALQRMIAGLNRNHALAC